MFGTFNILFSMFILQVTPKLSRMNTMTTWFARFDPVIRQILETPCSNQTKSPRKSWRPATPGGIVPKER